MSEHPIDDIFRKGLGKTQAPVPDQLWASIAADQKKKRWRSRYRKLGGLVSAIAVAAFLTTLIWSLTTTTDKSQQEDFTGPSPQATASPLEGSTEGVQATTTSRQQDLPTTDPALQRSEKQRTLSTQPNHQVTTTAGEATPAKGTPASQSRLSQKETKKMLAQEDNMAEGLAPSGRSGSYRDQFNEDATTKTNFKTIAEKTLTEGATTKTDVETIADISTPVEATTKTANATIGGVGQDRAVAAQFPSLDGIGNSAASPTPSYSSTSSLKAVAPIAVLPLPRLAPYEKKLSPSSAILPPAKVITKTPKGLEVDLLGGFAYAHQLLSTKDELNRSTLNAREISEFPEVSYLASLRLSYRLNKSLSIRSGLAYTQIRNQFEYDQMEEVTPDSVNTILIKSSNRIRMYELPLLVGYELPGKRFRLAINAGPIFNLNTKVTGRHLLPTQVQPVIIEENDIYRTNVGISWQLSLTAAYDLGQGNSLLVEPTFRTFPRTFTLDSYALNERYLLAGLQIGLRHRIR